MDFASQVRTPTVFWRWWAASGQFWLSEPADSLSVDEAQPCSSPRISTSQLTLACDFPWAQSTCRFYWVIDVPAIDYLGIVREAEARCCSQCASRGNIIYMAADPSGQALEVAVSLVTMAQTAFAFRSRIAVLLTHMNHCHYRVPSIPPHSRPPNRNPDFLQYLDRGHLNDLMWSHLQSNRFQTQHWLGYLSQSPATT